MTTIPQKQMQAMISKAERIAKLAETAKANFNGLKIDDLKETLNANNPGNLTFKFPETNNDDVILVVTNRDTGLKTTFDIFVSGNHAKNAEHQVTIRKGNGASERREISAAHIAVLALKG